MEGMNDEERQQYRDENRADWDLEDNDARQAIQEEIADYDRMVNEDLGNRKREQERFAFTLSRLSPSSAYQLATMNLAGTNTTLKSRYEESMKAYRTEFSRSREEKRVEERQRAVERQRGRGATVIFGGSGDGALDVSELPRYEAPTSTFAEAMGPSVVDVGLLAFFSIMCFGGAFVAFLRYDMR